MIKKRTRVGSLLLSIAVLLSMLPAAFAVSDLDEHWSQEAMETWIDYGVIQGYEDGSVRPDKSITRGELAVMLDRMMGYQTQATNTFADLGDSWYTDAILGAADSGVIGGYDDGTVRPEATISRQEAVVMIARVLGLHAADAAGVEFTDADAIGSWAQEAVNAMSAAGYIHGSNGAFRPTDGITRAEIVTILNNVFAGLCRQGGSYTDDVEGSLVVSSSDVSLEGMTVKGDLIIAEGVAANSVVLDSVTVEGRIIVRGGSTEDNAVIIKGDSSAASIVVERRSMPVTIDVQDGAQVGEIVAAGETESLTVSGNVDTVTVESANTAVEITGSVATLSVSEIASDTVVTVSADASVGTVSTAAENTSLNVAGSVQEVTISDSANNATVSTESGAKIDSVTTAGSDTTMSVAGTVGSVTVTESASGAAVNTDKGGKVDSVTTAGTNTTVSGDGTVSKVEAAEGSTGTTVETSGTKVENNSSEAVTTDKGTVEAGESGTTSGSTTSGGGSSSGGSSGGGNSHSHSYVAGVCGCGSYDPAWAQVDSVEDWNQAVTNSKNIIVTADFEANAQLLIDKAITVNGNGKTITAGSWEDSSPASKGEAPLVSVGAGSNAVVIKNITLTGAKTIDSTEQGGVKDYGHGLNVYESSNVTLSNVTLKDNAGAGLVVNSSTVKATGLHTSGNGWGGVNIDANVEDKTASLTFDDTSTFNDGEGKPAVYSDKGNVTVNAPEGWASTTVSGVTVWAKLFNGGDGTEESPYEIATAEQFKNISVFSTAMRAGTPYYFKQIQNITGFAQAVSAFCGEYDGNGFEIAASEALNKKAVYMFSNVYGTTTIKDVILVSNESVGLTTTVDPWYVNRLTISGIEAKATKTVLLENQSNFGFLMMGCVYDARTNPSSPQEITIENCTVTASVQNTADCTAGFIGSGYYPAQTKDACPKLVIRNCSMTGNVNGNTYAGLVFGNPSYHAAIDTMLTNSSISDETARLNAVKELVVLENISFNGEIEASHAGLFSSNGTNILLNTAYQDAVSGSYFINGISYDALTNIELQVYTGADGYQINDNQYTYKLIFKVQAIDVVGGTMNGRDVMIPLTYVANQDGGNQLKTGTKIHAYDSQTAANNNIISGDSALEYKYYCEGIPVAVVTNSDNTYLIFNADYVNSVNSTVTTYVYGYDNAGTYVGRKVINQN